MIATDRRGRQFQLSPEDADLLAFTWRVWTNPEKASRVLRTVHVREKLGDPRTERLATVVCERVFGAVPYGSVVAHLSGDTLDCRRENLTYKTKSEVLRELWQPAKSVDTTTVSARFRQ